MNQADAGARQELRQDLGIGKAARRETRGGGERIRDDFLRPNPCRRWGILLTLTPCRDSLRMGRPFPQLTQQLYQPLISPDFR
jgi:hypothetical protein